MNRKTIFALLMIIFASLMIASASAGFLDDVFEDAPTNVTYNGITFNIPEDFEENTDLNMTDLTFGDDEYSANVDYHFFTTG